MCYEVSSFVLDLASGPAKLTGSEAGPEAGLKDCSSPDDYVCHDMKPRKVHFMIDDFLAIK